MPLRLLERAWVGTRNARWTRGVARWAPMASLSSHALIRHAGERRRLFTARMAVRRRPELFATVESVCLFVGHVKSGGSLLGALLDAHPEAVMADEVDVPRLVEAGFRRDEIFHLLVKGARREAMKGRVTARRLEPYSLAVPGQWQGRHAEITLIGESRAGPTTRRLDGDPSIVERLADRVAPCRLRIIHVVRNPLDPIGAMVRRSGRLVENAIADYQRQAERVDRLRSFLPDDGLQTVHYEDLVEDPIGVVSTVFQYLGLDMPPVLADGIIAFVETTRHPERHHVEWTAQQLTAVTHIAESRHFLGRYVHELCSLAEGGAV